MEVIQGREEDKDLAINRSLRKTWNTATLTPQYKSAVISLSKEDPHRMHVHDEYIRAADE